MNRIGLFRGKRFDNGEWIYGFLVVDPNGKNRIFYQPFAGATHNTWYYVIPETVGQFTRLTTKNGTCIFEGDVVKSRLKDSVEPEGYFDYFCVVENIQGCWVLSQVGFNYSHIPLHERDFLYEAEDIEVAGNIHDKEAQND